MARLEIAYFGRLMDAVGTMVETVDVPAAVADSEALRAWLDERHGLDGALLEPTVRLALNDEIRPTGVHPIAAGDVVSFMPPVGGG